MKVYLTVTFFPFQPTERVETFKFLSGSMEDAFWTFISSFSLRIYDISDGLESKGFYV